MNYFIKGVCWSNIPNASHQEDNCVDMTYAIYTQDGVIASQIFATKAEAEQVLQFYITH
jgi:hypothetical protein